MKRLSIKDMDLRERFTVWAHQKLVRLFPGVTMRMVKSVNNEEHIMFSNFPGEETNVEVSQ